MIGGMDLSLESTYGLAPMIAAWLMVPVAAFGTRHRDRARSWASLSCSLVGAAVGLLNGFAIVKGPAQRLHLDARHDVVLGGIQDGMVNGQSLYDLPKRVHLARLRICGPDSGVAHSRCR